MHFTTCRVLGLSAWLLISFSPTLRAQTTTSPANATTTIFVPGSITGSPTPVDLDGDGKPEIVVAYMGMIKDQARGGAGNDNGPVLAGGREPDYAAYVGAFHADGTPVAGWPVTIMTAEHHKSAQPSM